MNKVQIYTCCILTLAIILGLTQHGKPKEGINDFRITFGSLILGLPYWGRIFGWW